MSEGRIGDKVGYVVLELNRFGVGWSETGDGLFDSISEAVEMVGVYEDRQNLAARKDTYAVARVELGPGRLAGNTESERIVVDVGCRRLERVRASDDGRRHGHPGNRRCVIARRGRRWRDCDRERRQRG